MPKPKPKPIESAAHRGMHSNKLGIMYPRTPSGATSLLDLTTEPTQRNAGDVLLIAFDADPEIVRAYVPDPLELDGSGRVYLHSYERNGFSERSSKEFISPERNNFTESFFYVPCTYKGEPFLYLLYSWVNRDWLAYLGRHIGQPHKLAKVQMTRFHPAHPVYYGPHDGVRICISVECVGTVLRGYVDLKREVENLPFTWTNEYHPRLVGWRYVWDVCAGKPALNDLVVHWADNHQMGPIWEGNAWLKFFDAENEEVLPFQPLRVVGGWWFTLVFDHQDSPPYVLHKFNTLSPWHVRSVR
jgi:acetoacetate decarboxylase